MARTVIINLIPNRGWLIIILITEGCLFASILRLGIEIYNYLRFQKVIFTLYIWIPQYECTISINSIIN